MERPRPSIDDLLAHTESVRALALRLGAGAHEVDDDLQEVWLQALRKPPGHGRNVDAWLKRTLGNALRMRGRQDARRRRREAAVAQPTDAADLDAAELAARAELHRELVRQVLCLPEPQRRMVLLHYFEGVEVTEIALRTDTTPDAVRAHLRRGRVRLRAELERGDSRAPFTGLVLAARPSVTGLTAATTGAAAAGAIGVAMSLHVKLLAGAAALALAAWFLWPTGDPATPLEADARPGAPSSQLTSRIDPGEPPEMTATSEASPRTEVPPPVEEEVLLLQGRLVGLHQDAPWTAPVEVKVQWVRPLGSMDGNGLFLGRLEEKEEHVAVDENGVFPMRLPGWTQETDFEMTVRAEDPWYEEIRVEFDTRVLSGDEPIVVHVRPVGVLTGKVVDPRGEPVPGARVLAFAAPGGTPQAPLQAYANTGIDGTYRLRVPVAAPLLVVAVAMHEMQLSGLRMTRYGGGIADNGQPRDDLVPASTWAASAFGTEGSVETVYLEEPAYVSGRVVWCDGSPAVGAEVVYRPFGIQLGNEPFMFWLREGTDLHRAARTDEHGGFRLPAVRGVHGLVSLHGLDGEMQVTDTFDGIRVTAPQAVELLSKGRPVTIRVSTSDGSPAAGSFVHWKHEGPRRNSDVVGTLRRRTNDDGTLRLVLRPDGYTVRATNEGMTSEEVRLQGDLPDVVELTLAPVADPSVTVELLCEHPIRQASFSWKSSGRSYVDRTLHRGDSDGPFVMRVPPGRYELRVRAAGGERNGTFLLPAAQEVVVPPAGGHFEVPVRLGGRLRILAVDASGLHLPGTCRLRGPDGKEVLPILRRPGRTTGDGELPGGAPAETVDNLPPGRYEVVLDLGLHGVHRREVEVRPREVAEVRVALP